MVSVSPAIGKSPEGVDCHRRTQTRDLSQFMPLEYKRVATACPDFAAFQKNMAALGLPAPKSLFETVQTATANVAAMLDGFKSVGTRATMSEIIGDRINIYMARGVGFYQL
ncbi:hypothetical protein [Paraburkholderia caribensis]|uniref:hypothetical protein n=2 Tax=Paraburkholderia TaxID=1822464 RepID=UPI00078CCD6D|nr:hypothetical protein [Paraburkholderia caribensis]AMV47269.1 hypothetical protein ATN79_42120 [Paraburkholderia caribensis]